MFILSAFTHFFSLCTTLHCAAKCICASGVSAENLMLAEPRSKSKLGDLQVSQRLGSKLCQTAKDTTALLLHTIRNAALSYWCAKSSLALSGAGTPSWMQLKGTRGRAVQKPSHRSPVVLMGYNHSFPSPSLVSLAKSQAGFTACADVSAAAGMRLGSEEAHLCPSAA